MNNLYKKIISKGVSGRMGQLYRGVLATPSENGRIEDDLTCDNDGNWYVIKPNPGDWGKYIPIEKPNCKIM